MKSKNQSGVILVLILLSLLAIGGTIFLVGMGDSILKRRADPQIVEEAAGAKVSLDATKGLLINYIISPPVPTHYPGILPTPDSLSDGSYSGDEGINCLGTGINGLPAQSSSNSVLKRCLGRVPWQALKMAFGDVLNHDPSGVIPWLAVSANLVVYDNCLKVLNSDIATLSSPITPACPAVSTPYPQPTTLPHKWLTVRDVQGNLLSDKVAAVLIMPGKPIATETRTQARTVGSPGHPKDYLDDIKLPLGCTSCTSYDNAGLTNEFIQIPLGTYYPDDSADTSKRGQKVPFNDTLIYITADEYVYYVERRVLAQMASAIKDSFTKTGSYPWAAVYAAPTDDSKSVSLPGALVGLFPFLPDSPVMTPIGYATNFNWSAPAGFTALTRDCRQVQTTPSVRWVNINENKLTQIGNSGTATGTAVWRGKAANNYRAIKFLGNSTTTGPTSTTFTAYSTSAGCTTNGTTSGTLNYNVTRSINFDIDVPDSGIGSCTGTFVRTYWPSSASAYQTTDWSCSSISPSTTFRMTVNDTIASPIAISAATPVLVKDATALKPLVVSGMRYQPVMPDWFFDHLWYQTAFYALARTSIPSGGTSIDCASATSIAVGNLSSSTAVVMLAGKRLTGTRPSATLDEYLEAPNRTGLANCSLVTSATPGNSSLNDNIQVVGP
jgi:hypothetical protein